MRRRAGGLSCGLRAILLTGVLVVGFALDAAALSLAPPEKEVTLYDLGKIKDLATFKKTVPKLRESDRWWLNDLYHMDEYSLKQSNSPLAGKGRAGRVTYGLQYNFSLVVSFQWDASAAAFSDFDAGVKWGSNIIRDSTDGQFRFDKVDIYKNGVNWNSADIQIENTADLRAYTMTTGQPFSGYIRLGSGIYGNPWNSWMGATTIAHEFGHHGFGLPDEYTDPGSVPRENNVCLMADLTSEFCTSSNHLVNVPGQNPQNMPQSAWARIKQFYPKATEVTGTPDAGPGGDSGTVVIWHFPDLSTNPSYLTFAPSSGINAGDNVTVQVGVLNLDSLASGPVTVGYYQDSSATPFATSSVNVAGTLVWTTAKWQAVGGTHTITAKIDSDGKMSEVNENNNSVTKPIVVNNLPTIDSSFSSVSGQEDVPLRVDFTPYGKDAEDAPANLRWVVTKVDAASIARYENTAVNTFLFYPKTDWNGNANIDVKVNDSKGAVASKTVRLNFAPVNDLPWVTLLELNLSQAYRLGAVGAGLNGKDKENAESDMKAEVEYRSATADWAPAPAAAWSADRTRFETGILLPPSAELGQYSFRARLTDKEGGTGEWYYINNSLAVQNNLPVAGDLTLSQPSVQRGEPVTVSLKAADAETPAGDLSVMLRYRSPTGAWKEVPGVSYDSDTKLWSADFTPAFTEPSGLYSFRVTVTDRVGDAGADLYSNESLDVRNGAPRVAEVKLAKKTANRLEKSGITVVAADNETQASALVVEIEAVPKTLTALVSAPEWSERDKAWKAEFSPKSDTVTGKYQFRARVKDADGTYSDWVVSADMVLQNLPPTADFRTSGQLETGKTVTFIAGGSKDPEGGELTYTWNFGDGRTGTGATATHAYQDGRGYAVTLMVRDRDGATDNKTLTVQIVSADGGIFSGDTGSTGGPMPRVYLYGLGALLFIGLISGAVIAVRRRRRGSAPSDAPGSPQAPAPSGGEPSASYSAPETMTSVAPAYSESAPTYNPPDSTGYPAYGEAQGAPTYSTAPGYATQDYPAGQVQEGSQYYEQPAEAQPYTAGTGTVPETQADSEPQAVEEAPVAPPAPRRDQRTEIRAALERLNRMEKKQG